MCLRPAVGFGFYLLAGGNANNEWNCGLFYGNWNNDASNSNWNYGAVPIFLISILKGMSGHKSSPLGENEAN